MSTVLNIIAFDNDMIKKFESGDTSLVNYLCEDHQDNRLILGQSWQVIHFGLTGEEWKAKGVLGQAIMGGVEFDIDLGAYLVSQEDVLQIAEALKQITKSNFIDMLSKHDLANVDLYTFDSNDPTAIEEVAEYYEKLKVFYLEAAKHNMNVVRFIS